MDWTFVALCAVILLIFFWVISVVSTRRRRRYLLEKYGDAALVERLMARQIWQGMTTEQLRDSWGAPADVDTKVFKTKTSHTFKYNQTGKNRFSNRIYIEDGLVVGWQQK